MKIVREDKNLKYKKGLHIVLKDNTSIYINKNGGNYQVSGIYGSSYGDKELDMFFSPKYASLKGCANYLKKNFDIDLDY